MDAQAIKTIREALRYGIGLAHILDRDGEWAYEALALLDTEAARGDRMRVALEGLLHRYVSLVDSGDAGSWDPEQEDEVKAARAALEGEA